MCKFQVVIVHGCPCYPGSDSVGGSVIKRAVHRAGSKCSNCNHRQYCVFITTEPSKRCSLRSVQWWKSPLSERFTRMRHVLSVCPSAAAATTAWVLWAAWVIWVAWHWGKHDCCNSPCAHCSASSQFQQMMTGSLRCHWLSNNVTCFQSMSTIHCVEGAVT